MRRVQKRKAEDFIGLLWQAHERIIKDIQQGDQVSAMGLLQQCQEGAISLGNLIESEEGEDFTTIPLLESYCELLFQIHQTIGQGKKTDSKKVYKNLKKSLLQIENSVKLDIRIRLEVVFLPYKASMWDSMESVWMAAEADPDCDACVVPIPYYDRDADGSLTTRHYEGNDFPDYVPVTDYEEYVWDKRPDMIYIHNPYDEKNYVTSVDPGFYSYRLKKYTDCLVYIPYYASYGGIGEGQANCPAYAHADFIIIQSAKAKAFFSSAVPKRKLIPLGSPKYDRVIRLCQNPPAPPKGWKERMAGRKVYFYNTGISGMLADTEGFLNKMAYVFQCFEGREDACLLWRPHPLLESSFVSMRGNYSSRYQKLKKYFIDKGFGIYDETPDITSTVALCDAYIGDTGTSVIALFGIAGKPLFFLDNRLDCLPGPDDWRGQLIRGFGNEKGYDWMITQGNQLYHSPGGDYQYEYCCGLSEYSKGNYYSKVVEIGEKAYICPANAQSLLVVEHGKVTKRIPLRHCLEKRGAFAGAKKIGKYLFLVPNQYPFLVRYDTEQERTDYISGCQEFFVKNHQGTRRRGGFCVWKNFLMLASPTENRILSIEAETLKSQIKELDVRIPGGYKGLISDGEDIWMSFFTGMVITRWNPETGRVCQYDDIPQTYRCRNRPYGHPCLDNPVSMSAFYKDYVYFSPCWGNMFLRLDKGTGKMEEWKPPFPVPEKAKNGYYSDGSAGAFVCPTDTLGPGTYRYFSAPDSKLYDVNLETGEYREIPVGFCLDEVKEHVAGFGPISQWLPYGCQEDCFNSLEAFLDGNVIGKPFDREMQIKEYQKTAVHSDGTSGEAIHRFFCQRQMSM